MFTWLNKQGVQSDAGFVVQRTDRFTCEYREGGHRIEVEVESGLMGDRPCLSIRRDAFSKWSGTRHAGETVDQQQARLMKNFKEAMEFQGISVVLF
jgi:hypothetical protein